VTYHAVADPEFYSGGRTVEASKAPRGCGLGRGLCLPVPVPVHRDLRSFEIRFEFESHDSDSIRFESNGLISRICRRTTNYVHCATKNFNRCAVVIAALAACAVSHQMQTMFANAPDSCWTMPSYSYLAEVVCTSADNYWRRPGLRSAIKGRFPLPEFTGRVHGPS